MYICLPACLPATKSMVLRLHPPCCGTDQQSWLIVCVAWIAKRRQTMMKSCTASTRTVSAVEPGQGSPCRRQHRAAADEHPVDVEHEGRRLRRSRAERPPPRRSSAISLRSVPRIPPHSSGACRVSSACACRTKGMPDNCCREYISDMMRLANALPPHRLVQLGRAKHSIARSAQQLCMHAADPAAEVHLRLRADLDSTRRRPAIGKPLLLPPVRRRRGASEQALLGWGGPSALTSGQMSDQ
jgi:hypothetical protein